MTKYDREGKRLYALQAKEQDLQDSLSLIRFHQELGIVTETWRLSTLRETYEFEKLEVVGLTTPRFSTRKHARALRDEMTPAVSD